tara:strand:- start:123 stop:419 length:297 start_codon:yes stop_codon:yes gene_type:complete
MDKLIYFIIFSFLVGCVSPAEIRAKRAAKDYNTCVSKGFKPNTDTFRLCLDNRQVERKANQAKWDAFMAKQAADSAKQGATQSCILGGGIMIGDVCSK